MTPELAATLKIHDEAVADGPRIGSSPSAERVPLRRHRAQAARPSLTLGQRESRQRRILALGDLVATAVSLLVIGSTLASGDQGVALVALAPLIIVLFKLAGVYDRDQLRLTHSTLDETPLLFQLTGLFTLAVAMLDPLVFGVNLSGRAVGLLWLLLFAAVACSRVLARSIAERATCPERCLVIGERQRAAWIRSKLHAGGVRTTVVATMPFGIESVGLLDEEGARHVVEELNVHRIIIAPMSAESSDVVEVIRLAKAAGVQVSVVPRMLEGVGSAVEFEEVAGMTFMAVRPFGLPRSSRAMKRAFDLVATSIGMVFVAPVIAVIGLLIRLDSPGPVFFRQVRVGRDGRHFRIFKFRTMVVGADEQKHLLHHRNEVADGMFKISDDPRVTRVGRVLRATSLDELPQLFNVLRGEMSLVGPRPLVTDEDARVVGLGRSRLHITPGMTGVWQILGTRAPMQEMIGMDYLYVANWSLWLDLKLLVRTLRHVVRGGNV